MSQFGSPLVSVTYFPNITDFSQKYPNIDIEKLMECVKKPLAQDFDPEIPRKRVKVIVWNVNSIKFLEVQMKTKRRSRRGLIYCKGKHYISFHNENLFDHQRDCLEFNQSFWQIFAAGKKIYRTREDLFGKYMFIYPNNKPKLVKYIPTYFSDIYLRMKKLSAEAKIYDHTAT